MKKNVLIFFSFLLLMGCKPAMEYELHGYKQKIIVEGFIGTNEFPQVYLSLNAPTYQQWDSVTILNKVIRTAKVTVSDGKNTEILTSQWEKNHFPPYVYKGTMLKGEEGKTYYLTVEYSGYKLTSTTIIPYASEVINFETKPVDSSDSIRLLIMNLDIKNKNNGFKVYTKSSNDKYFVESPFLYNENLNLQGINSFLIYPKTNNLNHSIKIGESLEVKVFTLDSTAVQFFKKITFFSTSTGIGKNIFIGENEPLPSNISSPGFGIWYGRGIRNYNVLIK